VPQTLVSFHAHPDDEALLTGGTLATAAARGHRVVLVVATLGDAGLASEEVLAAGPLRERRRGELEAAAAALGCARVEWLGYDDSGMRGEHAGAGTSAFSTADVDEAAGRLAALLDEESADVLTVYDPAGGYGHPDHVAVHVVGVRAAELARRAPRVLEATVDRASLLRAARFVSKVPGVPAGFSPDGLAAAYTPREVITHVVDVRAGAGAKRAAMEAHVSQAGGGDDARTLALFLRLPRPLFTRVFGREWFVERGCVRGPRPAGDIFVAAGEGYR
jgi:LmbE family N-acetylglucosaminyl deacetylase